MKVYYNSSLWDKGEGHWGLPRRVNWRFEHMGTRRCIPALYRFPEGIVFDIITFLDETKLREFFERYEAVERTLTPLERRCAEQEHPYQGVPIKEIWINGKRVERGYSSSSIASIPWAGQDDKLIPVRKAYSSILKDGACFACERFCVPYPETDNKIEKLLRFFRLNQIRSIKLSTRPVQWFSPLDISFDIFDKEGPKKVSFVHPQTGTTHSLYFQSMEHVKMPIGREGKRRLYTVQAMYEIEPPLPQGDSLLFNSSIQYTETGGDRFSPTAASSIGIIGGACGPTAIFAPGKHKEETAPCGLHGLPLYCCFSVPSFHKEDIHHFVLEGINIKGCDGKEYSFSSAKL